MALFRFKNMGDDGFLLLQLVLIVMEMFLLIFNGSESFSVKIQIMDISGFVSQAAPVSAPQFCPRTMKAGIGTMYIKGLGCVPKPGGLDLAHGSRLLTLDPRFNLCKTPQSLIYILSPCLRYIVHF